MMVLEDRLEKGDEEQKRMKALLEEIKDVRDHTAEALSKSLNDLKAAHHQILLELDEKNQENEKLTSEMNNVKTNAEKARTEATEYQSYLEEELETAKADVLDAANSLQDLQDKYDWVEKEHQDLQNQIDEMEGNHLSEIAKLKAENEMFKD